MKCVARNGNVTISSGDYQDYVFILSNVAPAN